MRLRTIRGGQDSKPLKREDQLRLLATQASGGNQAALRELLRSVSPAMLRVARRMVGANGNLAEDVMQESLLALVDALDRFRGTCTFTHFACRITVLTGMNVRRREATWQRHRESHYELLTAPGAPPPDDVAELHARAQALRSLLDDLPPADAEVIALHYIAEHTSTEIASLCGLPLETVRTRLKAARRRLRASVGARLDLVERDDRVEGDHNATQ